MKVHCTYTELVDPKVFKPNPRNPDRHSAAQVVLLAGILEQAGWRAPLTVSKRSALVVRGHGRPVPHATLVVPQDEVEAYRAAAYGLELVAIPPELRGISPVRNWIVRRFEEEVVVMYDDDVTACRTLAGLLNRALSPVDTEAMVENTAWSAKGAGARLFGWPRRRSAGTSCPRGR